MTVVSRTPRTGNPGHLSPIPAAVDGRRYTPSPSPSPFPPEICMPAWLPAHYSTCMLGAPLALRPAGNAVVDDRRQMIPWQLPHWRVFYPRIMVFNGRYPNRCARVSARCPYLLCQPFVIAFISKQLRTDQAVNLASISDLIKNKTWEFKQPG